MMRFNEFAEHCVQSNLRQANDWDGEASWENCLAEWFSKSHAGPKGKTCAEQGPGADCLQPPLLRRSGFQQRLSASVRRQ